MQWNEYSKSWDAEIEDMIGRHFETISIVNDPDTANEIYFEDKKGRFTFYHEQDCCEDVYIESIVGDPLDLVWGPMLRAEESTSHTNPELCDNDGDSVTWTFYKFATFKGYVDIRWCGRSNGYYSESVSLRYDPKDPNELPHP
jgi:hypothetical protein